MKESKAIKDLLGRLVAKLETAAPYADALYLEQTTRALTRNKTETDVDSSASAGVKLRAFDGQRFHELCIQGWQPLVLQTEVQQLIKRLKERATQGKQITIKNGKEQLDKEFSTTPHIDPATVPIEEKIAMVETLHKRVLAHSSAFINCNVHYREEEEKRVFVSRTKRLASTWTGCTIAILPFVKTAQGEIRHGHYSAFATGFEVKNIPDEEFATFLKRTLELRTAKRITPGAYTVVLHPMVTGLLAHESFGHGMEADMILHGRARAGDYLGKRIANPKVNICEDPSIPSTHGFLFFDDEGALPERTYLVEKGIVTAPITEAYSASRLGIRRTANGRAESFDRKIYARMTNTFFLAGKDDPKDLIKSVKNGIYVHSGSSGMEDPKGWGVQVAGLLCERIKGGKLTGELFYEATMGGDLPTILGNIKGIGKDFEITKDAGFCGKGHKEYVRVSSGGPHLLIEGVQLS